MIGELLPMFGVMIGGGCQQYANSCLLNVGWVGGNDMVWVAME